MTAKQRLAERVDDFTEEEAAGALAILGLEEPKEWPEFPPASPRIMDLFRRAMADSEAGRSISDEEFGRRHHLE